MNEERRTQNEELRTSGRPPFSILRSAFCVLHSGLKQHRFALALIALLAAILFFGPLIKGEAFSFRDHTDYFQPLRWFTAQELGAGRLPLWNPYNGSGEPWLANPQTGVFYPPAWIFVVLPFAAAYMLHLMFHLVLLGWGAYLLFARTASTGAAMVGAVALMLAGPTLSLLDVSNNLATFAWIPLVLWCAAERAPIRGAFALALAFLAGEPFFAAIAAALFVIASRRMRDIAIAGFGALGLAAVQLLPFLEMVRGSDRAGGLAASHVLDHSMPLRDWMHLFTFPRLDENGFDPRLGQHFIPLIYIGALILPLALAGLVIAYRRRDTHGWLALLAVAVVIANGPALLGDMPVTLFRYPSRLVPFGALAIIALAVAGWDRIRPNKRWADLIVVLVIATDLTWRAKPLLESSPAGPHRVLYGTDVGQNAKILRVGEMPPGSRTSWVSGYLNLYQWRFDAGTPAPVVDARYVEAFTRLIEKPTGASLAEFPIGHIITTRELGPPFLREVRVGRVSVYRFPPALPMARARSGASIVPASVEMGTSGAVVTIETAVPATLLLTQRDAPGWRVTIDGERRAKNEKEPIFLATDVPAGRHRVVFSYRPASLFIGAAATFFSLASVVIFLLVKRSRGENFFFLSHKM